MIVLGIDGALGSFSAAVAVGGRRAAAIEIAGHSALEQGLSAIASVIREASLTPQAIERIGVGIGPGTFTGVRIAISFAKSLAQGWCLPLTGVNSFDLVESGLEPQEPALAAVRGRTGVVSVRLRNGLAERRFSGYVRDVAEQLGAGGIPPEPVRICGATQDVVAALAERGWSLKPVARATLPAALAAAIIAGEREPARSFHEVRADYGELPAAKIPKLGGAQPR